MSAISYKTKNAQKGCQTDLGGDELSSLLQINKLAQMQDSSFSKKLKAQEAKYTESIALIE